MKDTYYFTHDFHARSDEKILKLLQKEGWAGYGLYWAIVEKLYEAGGIISEDYDVLAYDLRTENDKIYSIINNFSLFNIEEGNITSNSVKSRLLKRAEKSETARKNIMERWGNDQGRDIAKKQIFYVIEIFNEKERFIKCGITSNSVNRRYSGKLGSYQFVILSQIDVEVSQAIECERYISNIAKRYTPSDKFGGYLECFSIESKAEILDFVIQCEYKSNTIKERKGKEIKIKESKTETRARSKKKVEENPEKIEVEKLVHLLPEEIEKVKAIYGNLYKNALLKLSSHKESKGVKYTSDYGTLHRGGWVYDYMVEKYPTLKSVQILAEQTDTNNDHKKKEQEEKDKTETIYKEIRAFYATLSEDEKKKINDRADYELKSFTPKMREASGKKWQDIFGAKVRAITSTYRDTGEIPEVPPPPAEKETLPPNT